MKPASVERLLMRKPLRAAVEQTGGFCLYELECGHQRDPMGRWAQRCAECAAVPHPRTNPEAWLARGRERAARERQVRTQAREVSRRVLEERRGEPEIDVLLALGAACPFGLQADRNIWGEEIHRNREEMKESDVYKPPNPEDEQKRCDEFNRQNPVGTVVDYWRALREGRPSGTGKTTTPAQLLSGHTAVIWIEGCRGCISLSHVAVRR